MFLLVLITLVISNVDSKQVDIKFIKDFVEIEFHVIKINAFLCWEKHESINLIDELLKINVGITIQNVSVDDISHNKIPEDNLMFLLDANCNESNRILVMANELKLFISPYKWLLLSTDFEEFRIENRLDELNILIDSAFYLGEKLSENNYTLNEVFKLNRTWGLENREIANWTYENGFENYSNPTILSDRRKNLKGCKIVAAVVVLDNDTLNHLWDYRNIHKDSITKLNMRLVNIMVDYLNGTRGFEYYDSWGYKKPSETVYTGMIGAMQHGNAELGSTSLFVNTERIKVIDYLSWTTPTYIQFVYRQPPLSYVSNLFTLPFSRTVWVSILGLFFLSIILIYLIALWERRYIQERKFEDDSFIEVVMLAVGAVCQQGTTYEPTSGTGKIITFLIFTALLFIYVSYSAYIVVLLQSSSDQIKNLEDLLNSKMDYGLLEVVYNHFYFENATERVRKAIYQKKILPKGPSVFMTLEEGVRRVREGFFAFHAETPPVYTVVGETFLESEKCGLQTLQYIEATQFWLPVKKKSAYREVMKVCLRKLHECGIQTRESNRLFTKKPVCLGGGNNFVSVGLIDAGPAFVFLGFGFAVAILVFLLELLVKKISCKKIKMAIKVR